MRSIGGGRSGWIVKEKKRVEVALGNGSNVDVI
jgi:hypothetical protein